MNFIKTLILVFISTVSFSQSFYDFEIYDIDSNKVDLHQFKGKKILVVNTASKCGFTPQYTDLEKLYKTYKDSNFVIIGFPANNFLKQEPGTNKEIKEFCSLNFGVSFPMMAKISVKGDDIHSLYIWLTSKDKNGLEDSKVKWNFQKYMINEDGTLHGYVNPNIEPFSDEIVNWIISK
jgi:glutathione peroxidase